MLEVRGIDVSYGHVQALHGVSLTVNGGEVVALVGSNGAGKTTTLRTISGLNRPLAGEVLLDGNRIDRLAPEDIVKLGVAHLPEGRGIFPSLTVEENLWMGFYTKRRNRKRWEENVERMTELFPRIRERWSQAAGTMSGGEQQMVALARALLTEPRLLMVDELSLGLAPVVVQQLFRTLEETNREGTTILLVEQYVNLALRVADRAYVLEKGRVVTSGTPAQLQAGGTLVSSYLGDGEQPEPEPTKPARRTRKAVTT
jgi:branched-chain amino acid transport system ATP-binding protein